MPGSFTAPKPVPVPKPVEEPVATNKGRVESTVHRGEVDSASDLAARLTGGYSGIY